MRMCPLCVAGVLAIAGASTFMFVGGAAPAPAPAPVAQAAAEPFAVDSLHSSIVFRIKHNNVSWYYGRFNKVSGSFSLDASKPEAASIDVTVDATSVDTANADRDKHLSSQSFFSVKEFPTLTFKSTGAKKGAGDKIDVTGDLTIHGVKKTVTVSISPSGEGPGMQGGTTAGFETSLVIKRSDYGMKFMPDKLGDEVTLMLAFEGARK